MHFIPAIDLRGGRCVRLLPDDVKRPQMQWNLLERRGDPELLRRAPDPAWAYFVHSYAAEETGQTIATCDYGGPVVGVVGRDDTLWATQFHPEKSGPVGLQLRRNFVELVG